MTRVRQAAWAALLVAAACPASTDLGASCRLTKACGDGGSCVVKPSELTDPGVDYLSLDSTECDESCLRTAGSDVADGGAEVAMGYCTRPCRTDAECGPLACEQLLLSQPWLLGSSASPTYCVEPRGQ